MTTLASTSSSTTTGRFRFLRLALRLDGITTGIAGLQMLATGLGLVPDLVGIPAGWQTGLGVFLVAYAAGVFALSLSPEPRPGLVWTVIAVNAVWVADSVIALVAGMFDLTAFGVAWAILQAVVVAVFAELQYTGLRRSRRN